MNYQSDGSPSPGGIFPGGLGAANKAAQVLESINKLTERTYQPGVLDRIQKTLSEAEYVSERAAAAYEAREILNKYPDFARLLDLLGRF